MVKSTQPEYESGVQYTFSKNFITYIWFRENVAELKSYAYRQLFIHINWDILI